MTARSPGAQRCFEHGIDIRREVAKAVPAAPGSPAAPMTAVVERDHPVIGGQVGDLIGPHSNGAGDAMREHDRVPVLGPEYLGVQAGAVRGAHLHGAARRQGHR